MNVLWWPLPGRRHWWEKTEWVCGGEDGCGARVARGRWGKGVEEVFGGVDGGAEEGRREEGAGNGVGR